MTVVELADWAVVYANDDPWMPPEAAGGIALAGVVTGHPKMADGMRVQTPPIVAADGRNITTEEKGVVFRLGEPSEGYRAWLAENRPNWDPENPIKILEN